MRLSLPLGACCLLALVSACSSGSSSGGAIEGLAVAEQMSVVTVEDDGSSSVVVAGPEKPTFPADSDYATDVAESHVYDSSMETLSTVNSILCMLSQSGYTDLVNEGPYRAQIDEHKCDEGSSGGETGQSSGGAAEAPSVWVVDSTREGRDTPQVVDFWVPQHDDDPTALIHAHMTITEGATDENPFGSFELQFAMVSDTVALEDTDQFGSLATVDAGANSIGFTFYENDGDVNVAHALGEFSMFVQANVSLSADQTTGFAYIVRESRSNFSGVDSGVVAEEFKIAFDTANVLRQKDSDPEVCLSRTTFDTNVWRYNLYHASGEDIGERVDLNSGFGFQTKDGDYGWIGYYGLWTPPGVDLASGDTVTRHVYGDEDATEYTVVKAPGKLIKNTRHTLDLVDAEGEQFEWWDFGPPGNPTTPARYMLEYETGFFYVVAEYDEQTQQFEALSRPYDYVDTAAYGFLGMWSQALGGSVSYRDGDDFLIYFAQEFVNKANELFSGGDTIDLYGYRDCLASGITGAEAEAGDVYLPQIPDVIVPPHHFVFDGTDLTLYYDTDNTGNALEAVGLANGQAPESGPFTWGMRSGPLVLDTSGFLDPNDVWAQDVFYVYETGHNPWNQYASLVDALGDAVTFDAPIQFTYVHSTENDVNESSSHDGNSFLLSYNGPGDLFGIPSNAFDTDNDGNPDRYYPVFGIADGTLMGPDGSDYVVRAIAKELTLALDVGACGALDLADAGALTLPDPGDFVAPDIGTRPEIDAPPRVIEGVIQGADAP